MYPIENLAKPRCRHANNYKAKDLGFVDCVARTNQREYAVSSYQRHQKPTPCEGVGFLVYPIGFEPTAPSVGGLCSIQLSYGYVFYSMRNKRKLVTLSIVTVFPLFGKCFVGSFVRFC